MFGSGPNMDEVLWCHFKIRKLHINLCSGALPAKIYIKAIRKDEQEGRKRSAQGRGEYLTILILSLRNKRIRPTEIRKKIWYVINQIQLNSTDLLIYKNSPECCQVRLNRIIVRKFCLLMRNVLKVWLKEYFT